MSYGLEIYNNDGRLQFSTDDPALYLKGPTGINTFGLLPQVQQVGSSFYYKDNGFPRDSTLVHLVRPVSGTGMVGIDRWNGKTYVQQPYSWRLNNGTVYAPTSWNYQTFWDTTDLSDDGGYGLTCRNAAGDITFTTNPSGDFLGYIDFVKIVPAGTTRTGSGLPGMPIYTAPSAAAWDNTYVVLHNHVHEMVATAVPGTTLPSQPWLGEYQFNANIGFFTKTYYFENSTRTIYACEFTFNQSGSQFGTWISSIGDISSPNNLTGTMSYPSTLGRDYFVVQAYRN